MKPGGLGPRLLHRSHTLPSPDAQGVTDHCPASRASRAHPGNTENPKAFPQTLQGLQTLASHRVRQQRPSVPSRSPKPESRQNLSFTDASSNRPPLAPHSFLRASAPLRETLPARLAPRAAQNVLPARAWNQIPTNHRRPSSRSTDRGSSSAVSVWLWRCY
jgi:hypothetical protein